MYLSNLYYLYTYLLLLIHDSVIHSLKCLPSSTQCPQLLLSASDYNWDVKYLVPCHRANPGRQSGWIAVIKGWPSLPSPSDSDVAAWNPQLQFRAFRLVPGSIIQGAFPGTKLLQACVVHSPTTLPLAECLQLDLPLTQQWVQLNSPRSEEFHWLEVEVLGGWL